MQFGEFCLVLNCILIQGVLIIMGIKGCLLYLFCITRDYFLNTILVVFQIQLSIKAIVAKIRQNLMFNLYAFNIDRNIEKIFKCLLSSPILIFNEVRPYFEKLIFLIHYLSFINHQKLRMINCIYTIIFLKYIPCI